MQTKRWSRIDQLSFEGLLWALPALGTLAMVVQVVGAVRGDEVEVSGPLPDALLPDGVRGPLTGSVVLPDPTASQQVLSMLPSFIGLAMVVVAAWLLLRVARSARNGEPFTVANARRLTGLSILVMVGGMMLQVVDNWTRSDLLASVPAFDRDGMSFELSLWPLLVGFLVAFFAEVFRRGAALREDVEGLV